MKNGKNIHKAFSVKVRSKGLSARSARTLGESPHMLIGGDESHVHIPMSVGDNACSVDWLAGSVPMDKLDSFLDFLKDMYEINPIYACKSIQLYDSVADFSPYGCSVYYDSDSERCKSLHRGRFAVRFSGSGLQNFTANGLFKLFYHLLHDFWFKATRIDLNFDDYSRVIAPWEIAEHADAGNYSGYRRHQHVCSKSRAGEILGDTVYFGRRGKLGSGRFLRIYDKNLESDGEFDCVRYEVEYTKEKARLIALRLGTVRDISEFAGTICGLVGSSIDFIHRKGKNLDRATRLKFWADVVEMLGSVQLRNPVRVQTVERTADHIERLSASLALIKLAYGHNDFDAFIQRINDIGEDDLPESHKRRLDVFRGQSDVPF